MSEYEPNANPDSSHRNKPWYRQFWPWFIILLPASSVVAGLTTLAIAVRNADSVVVDDWYRQGKAVNLSRQAEERARELGVQVVLENRDDRALLTLSGLDTEPGSLSLVLRHPTLEERDQTLRLGRVASGRYRAPGPLPEGDWHTTLRPEPGDWRLRARLTFSDGGRYLLPEPRP